MWLDFPQVERNWEGGSIVIDRVLYEFEGPVVFSGRIGLNKFLFAKRDEGDEFDFYVAVETDERTISALGEGRLSLRGALSRSEGWLIETDLTEVVGFQYLRQSSIVDLLPAPKVGLFAKFGAVPDTLEQADAFISFRFLGDAVKNGQVSLAVLQEKISQFSTFVRKALTPPSLNNGKDYRFFDVQMAEPRFSSLVLAAKRPEFNLEAIRRSYRLQGVDADRLLDEAGEQGRLFWDSLEFANVQIKQNGRLTDDFVEREQAFLTNIEGLIPTGDIDIERVEVTFNDGARLRTVLIDKEAGEKIADAQERLKTLATKTIIGVITEVNGDSATFIIKDLVGRQTTCGMPRRDFDMQDEQGNWRRGRQVSLTGIFTNRPRRDHIWLEKPVVFLN